MTDSLAWFFYDDPARTLVTYDDAILATSDIPMYRAGSIPDDDYGLLEGGHQFYTHWDEFEEPEDASDDEPPSNFEPGPEDATPEHAKKGYNLRNYILTVFGEILRCNPVFMFAYLQQALVYFEYKLEQTCIRDSQMREIRDLVQVLPPSSTILRSERDVLSALPVIFTARFIQRAGVTNVLRQSIRRHEDTTNRFEARDTEGYINPKKRPKDLYTNQTQWNNAVTGSRKTFTKCMKIYDQIQHITDQWTAIDAPMRIDPNDDHVDEYDSDDEIMMTDQMIADLARGRKDKLLGDTIDDFDREWTHNCSANSTTTLYSIVYARTAAPDDWATLGTAEEPL